MDKSKFQYEGIKWIMEMELLNHPQAINTIKFNILMVSKRIKEVELLIYRENKSMLVLLELSWFGRKFRKKQIFTEVHEVLSQLLPSFRFRVIDDPKIMQMAIERVQKALTGGKNENSTNNNNTIALEPNKQEPKPSESTTINKTGSLESVQSDSEKPSEAPEGLLPEVSGNDRKEE